MYKVNLPARNSRYRGPIESAKIEDILNMLAASHTLLGNGLSGLRDELNKINSQSVALYGAIHRPYKAGAAGGGAG